MNKPAHLRAAIEAALPDLRANPDKLKLYVDRGGIANTGTASRSFEYRYQLKVLVIGFGDHPDVLFITLQEWLREHQPELLLNPERQRDGLHFQVDIIDHTEVDIEITLQLTERVGVKSDPANAGRWIATHFGEPPLDPYAGQDWELVVMEDGEQVWPTT
ncbi:phage tail protein [Crenobacter sp. SG2303]|uniref:Phage tail protein n=1 Tax=Crenobacter oryzisoli TaxID=3056844 RepID=A0ABT7XP99_9NEIS|nr:phage tail protein [Crenobacter sp. SG2303]MDN0075596.1 phage tail protein [Crenobacter sp. SG2303]